jgi:carbon-monoxide dehydrogenase large subunit
LRAGGAWNVGLLWLGHSHGAGIRAGHGAVTPDGGLELRVGVHSHGQGLETTLAQVAHEILGIDVAKIRVVHGDTAMTPYSTGTWGSRCMVMAGGAVSTACKEIARRAIKVGAQLLQANADHVTVRGGEVVGPQGSISLGEIARTWYSETAEPSERRGLWRPRGHNGYKPARDSGTFSYATHAALVAVDPEIGDVEILDYVIVEDGGKLVNPMIVDGPNLRGLRPRDRHRAVRRDAVRHLGTAARLDICRLSPAGPTEVPAPRLDHMETLAPYTEFGVKGIGEGGAIAPPRRSSTA